MTPAEKAEQTRIKKLRDAIAKAKAKSEDKSPTEEKTELMDIRSMVLAYEEVLSDYLHKPTLKYLKGPLDPNHKAVISFKKAIKIAKKLRESYYSHIEVPLLAQIAKEYSKAGQNVKSEELLNDALLLSKDIADRAAETEGLAKIACVYAEIGKDDLAKKTFSQATDMSHFIPEASKRALALRRIAREYAKADY